MVAQWLIGGQSVVARWSLGALFVVALSVVALSLVVIRLSLPGSRGGDQALPCSLNGDQAHLHCGGDQALSRVLSVGIRHCPWSLGGDQEL